MKLFYCEKCGHQLLYVVLSEDGTQKEGAMSGDFRVRTT